MNLSVIVEIVKTIYFNFKYLPVRQAIKIPIYIHNVKFMSMKGRVIIDSQKIHRGMVSMGFWGLYVMPNTPLVWENKGGTVIFKGKCKIGNGGGITVCKNGILTFGQDFINSQKISIICSRRIEFGEHCRLGWNTFVMDTNMHPLKDGKTHRRSSGGKSIKIGDCNWFSTNCVILPGVETPERIICGLGTVVTRGVDWQPWCLYGGSPIRKLRENVYRDFNDDKDEQVYI